MNEWMDGQKKEGRKEKPESSTDLQRPQKGSSLSVQKFLVTRTHGALHFNFALGSANYVTGPTLGKYLWKFHCMKWMEYLFSVFLRFKQLSVNWGGVGQLWILWLKLQTGPGLKLVLLYPDFIAEEHLSLHPAAGDLLQSSQPSSFTKSLGSRWAAFTVCALLQPCRNSVQRSTLHFIILAECWESRLWVLLGGFRQRKQCPWPCRVGHQWVLSAGVQLGQAHTSASAWILHGAAFLSCLMFGQKGTV